MSERDELSRLRDHFAASALTGLLAQGDDGSFSEESYVRAAYRWADAMLRERARETHNTQDQRRLSRPLHPLVRQYAET